MGGEPEQEFRESRCACLDLGAEGRQAHRHGALIDRQEHYRIREPSTLKLFLDGEDLFFVHAVVLLDSSHADVLSFSRARNVLFTAMRSTIDFSTAESLWGCRARASL